MNRRRLLQTAALFAAAGFAPPTWGQTPVDASALPDGLLLDGLMRGHIAPRLGALADAAAALVPTLERLATQPAPATMTAARDAYGATMTAWAGAQHLRPGPLLLHMRAERLAFWPDKRGVVRRQLTQLLARRDAALLASGALPKQSAAVQGLPALERLLFEEGVNADSFAGEAGAYRGGLAAAVGRNVAALTAEVRAGWTEPQTAPAGETLTNLFLSLVTSMQMIVDQKLLIPLGASAEDAKPALAEAVLSGRSLKQIAAALAGVRAMLTGENAGPGLLDLIADADERRTTADQLAATFDAAETAVAAVPEPLDKAVVAPQARPQVEAAFRAAKAAQNLITADLPARLGVTLGFNELDGD